ncbi:PREDICTED: uncharacterized protein LOC106791804 [Polistes canadensis]|uniref:uncharacterized protein LOC106791804 n=1 Tax=Polistes canadensis TaxID=91411 RepID=UPI000718FB0F|nr:PREDICTED: uncharacterized protein LOC106791804 [Polistes canadensis]XP_014613224.1 PREDICTED: uncharacterized protein LOC106791804 [Polistes canadensis]
METDHECMDKCVKNCKITTNHDCSSKCSHCIRRKKQRTQIITEYETECIEGDCNKKDDKPSVVGMANITTNMVINNVIRTDTEEPTVSTIKPPHPRPDCNCTCCDDCAPCPPWCCPHHRDHYHGDFYHGDHYRGGYYGGFHGGLQLSLVPQLSLGLGLSPSFDCIYPYHWFCNRHNHYHTSGIDCSGCHHPVNQHRCHSSCYEHHSYGSRMKREDEPCKSPHCVGGI